MSGKTKAILDLLFKRRGDAKSITVRKNHDTGQQQIEVEHESEKKSLIVSPVDRWPDGSELTEEGAVYLARLRGALTPPAPDPSSPPGHRGA